MSRQKPRTILIGAAPSALESARVIVAQRKTCEGCHMLQLWPRPQCKGPTSPHYRMVRDTYHQRCDAFAVRPKADAPPEPEALPLSRGQVAGEVSHLKRRVSDPEHFAMLQRNAARKVG